MVEKNCREIFLGANRKKDSLKQNLSRTKMGDPSMENFKVEKYCF